MDDSELARSERAAERHKWSGGKTRLVDSGQPPLVSASPAERLAMVWPLTCDAWALAGKPMPSYSRDEAPGKVLRPA